ncbi:expressed protein [Phakopsora pachyrhizi]|uniref:Expressed protein n=1 Tax=Phakopsora pachyrhizi TaxID=170000 RepID=A0AAV0AER6_PHAPC|nr:expressed protein [Phakopsora pachyrhizi]
MFSRALPAILCVLFLISGISALASQTSKLIKRSIADGLYTTCQNTVVKHGCNNLLDQIWNSGQIKRFTTKHQFVVDSAAGCKITWWADSGVVRANDNQKSSLQQALQQIDDACTASGISTVYDRSKKGAGVYVGRLFNDQYVAIMAETGVQ